MKYDLEGICQDCMYLEKIKPLFEEKNKEIDRLNNIINELEEYLEKQQREQSEYCDFFIKDKQIEVQEVLDKLKELKEDNNV